MKTINKLALLAFAAVSLTALPSCLKEDNEVFEDSPSVRIQQSLEKTKKILESQSNGWVMFVYPVDPSSEYISRGYIYTVKFSDSKVTARSERDSRGAVEETSYYKLTNDEGPVLSFDTGNTILHYWSTPGASSSLYEGRGGDFEFNILEAKDDYVKLVGKRYRATAELFPIDKEASEYIADCLALKQNQDSYFGITAGDVKGTAEFYVTSTYQVLWIGDYLNEDEELEEVEVPFVFLPNPDRIRLYKPVTLGGETFQELTVNADELTAVTLDNSNVVFGHPHSYRSADEIAGDYKLIYNVTEEEPDGSSIDVTLEKIENEEGVVTGFSLKGLNENWAPVLGYDDWYGTLDLRVQNLGRVTTNTNGYVRLCFADLSYYNWALTTTSWPYSATTNFRFNVSGTYYNNCYFTIEADLKDASNSAYDIKYSEYTYSSRYYDSWYLNCYSTATGTTNRYALDLTSGWGFNIPGTGKPTAADEELPVTEQSVALPYPTKLIKK